MKSTLKNIFGISIFCSIVIFGWGLPVLRGTGPGKQSKSHFISVPDSTPQDTSKKLPFPFKDVKQAYETPQNGGLFLKDPSNVSKSVTYDPVTRQYIFTDKIGDYNFRLPYSMSFDEYQKWDMKQAIQDYWKTKSQTYADLKSSGILPSLKIGGELFQNIFGGNTIDIRPQGSAELIFGILSNRRQDPALDVRLQRMTNFDFQEKIQMAVQAKIGDKIQFNTNYNTEATFDFENKLKLNYEGKEDEILKLVEVGNINFPLNSSLITGSQSLFGIKTQMKFGRALLTAVFSQQQSQVQNIMVQGGNQTTKYKMSALEYEDNKHFFTAQYFRNHYNQSMATLPVIGSNINITKIEVWITNIGAAITENRNIVAFQDLGEYTPYNRNISQTPGGQYPSNNSNNLLTTIDTNQVRDINIASNYLMSRGLTPGIDFEKIENARKLNPSEFTYSSKLGFISLNTRLNPDQVLAVAYQYTVVGSNKVYQVGEFSNEGVSTTKCLMVKLLRSTAVNTHIPMWNLMMKNVYNIGAYQVNPNDFILNLTYAGNDNAVPTGYLTDGPANVKGVPLLQVLALDRLDQQLNPPPDGLFDFVDNTSSQLNLQTNPQQGYQPNYQGSYPSNYQNYGNNYNGRQNNMNIWDAGTIRASTGRVYFPVTEPFGSYLRSKINDNAVSDRYCFDSLYTLTKTGAQQYPDKNKFYLEGQYKTASGSDIDLHAFNVPQGSVKVTAGGVPLMEGIDYTVDYTQGKVKIINEGILNSGTPINISTENNTLFNVYNQTMMGAHLDYKVSNDLNLGATILNLYERPITQKVNYGDEPISNTMLGLNANYQTQSGWVTKMIDKLPFYSTKAPSNLRFDGEFADLIPGHSRSVGKTGISYIDDFEGTKSTISMTNPGMWFMASTPEGQLQRNMFPEAAPGTGLEYGKNRAKLAWYTIDPIFYDNSSTRFPSNITKDEMSKNAVRYVRETELFPNIDEPNGIPRNLAIFNLSFYPTVRGPNNYDVSPGTYSGGVDANGLLINPSSRWGGIMRKIETTDFEAANVEYLTFWMMDPFIDNPTNKGGELYFNLGDISEDILRDGRKSYENGLPVSDQVKNVDTTIWGRVPTLQALTESFSNDPTARQYQDVGLDGLSDQDEQSFFAKYLQNVQAKYGSSSKAFQDASKDPSADDYHYFLGGDLDQNQTYSSVLERYKNYNGTEGNSPTPQQSKESYPTLATTLPDVEDINRDNTLSDQERYYQYVVHLRPEDMNVGENYIADKYVAPNVELTNGKKENVTWYQFKIPIHSPDQVIGNIQDMTSIRFMRMFMKNFSQPIVCRFATLELERGEWRKYYNSLLSPGEYIPDPNIQNTNFDLSTVSIEENGSRQNVPYVLPPGIQRERNAATTNYQQLNEQSMVMKICNLIDGDARAAYKTTSFDFRQYKRMKMYVHAEKSIANQELKTGDLTVFIRFGSDFTNNYYEYEVPLTFTRWGTTFSDVYGIWPEANQFDVDLQKIVTLKEMRNGAMGGAGGKVSMTTPYTISDGANTMTVLGSPSLSDVRTVMIGIRNPKRGLISNGDDGQSKCAEIWVDELRLTDFIEDAGWAGVARMSTNLADLGNLVISGAYSTPGFGSIEQKVNNRQKEAIAQVDIATNLELGKLLPPKTGIRIPLHYDYSRTVSTPKYNPLDPDVLLSEQLNRLNKSEKDSLRQRSQDVTTRRNINFMNVRKERRGSSKVHLWDIENFDFSYAYTDIRRHNVDIAAQSQRTYRGGIGYNYAVNPKFVRPFQRLGNSEYLKLLRDFNFSYLPKILSFRTDMFREYDQSLMRNKSESIILLQPTFNKRWDWNRNYDMKFDLTQGLKFDYSAIVNAYIYEPPGDARRSTDYYQAYKDTVMRSIMGFGKMNTFNQSMNFNYAVPINKLPYMDWVNLTARYSTIYRWEASARSVQERIGNSVDNASGWQATGSFRLTSLYSKFPFLKKFSQYSGGFMGYTPVSSKPPPKQANDTAKARESIAKIFSDVILGVLTSFKEGSFTINQQNSTLLPGFMYEPGPLGNNWKNNAPGLGFIFGSQRDLRQEAAANGWLSTDSLLNNPYITRKTNTFSARAGLEPFRDLRIELTADRTSNSNYQEYFTADATGQFRSTAPQENGSFNMSYILLRTAFKKDSKDDISPVFEQMLANRIIIARRLAAQNPNSKGIVDSTGFPTGYGPNSAEVLMGAFMSAYSGSNPARMSLSSFPKIPLPNWRITYNLYSAIKPLQEIFQSFNITHAYRADYSIGNYLSDINYRSNEGFASNFDQAGNFIPYQRIDVVSVTEQFGPLIGLDVTMKNSMLARFEIKKTRNLSLSFVNSQLTETKSNEIVVGFGYRIKNVRLVIKSLGQGGGKANLKSDLNIRADFSIRDNKTILRRVEEDNNQISTGSRQYSINTSADYLLSQKLTIRFYFDKTINKPYVSLQYPNSTTSAGLSLRFTLTQ